MSVTSKKAVLLGLFVLLYGLLFFFQITGRLKLDFSSFYSSAIAYIQGIDPYQSLLATYLLIPVKLTANLNPPIFLQLMSPLTHLNFQQASSFWFIISFLLGSIGALLSFKITSSRDYFKKHWIFLLFIYLAMYSTLMSISIGQIGGILIFFIMAGYYCYLHKQDSLAGVLWGIIIAIKLFPALIFLFVLNQKRYKVFLVMLLTSLSASFLPLLFKGAAIYSIYFEMLSRVLWFGDNWNASLYGFLFRLFVNVNSNQNLLPIKITYLFFFIILLIWYIKKINLFLKTTIDSRQDDHRAFCLTLVMMLLMSPMGWAYYFSLLIMPLTIIYQSLNQESTTSNKEVVLWVAAIFFINFPIGYVKTPLMSSVLYKLSIYSFYFYGLILIAYLVSRLRGPSTLIIDEQHRLNYIYPLNSALALGIFITLGCFIMQLL